MQESRILGVPEPKHPRSGFIGYLRAVYADVLYSFDYVWKSRMWRNMLKVMLGVTVAVVISQACCLLRNGQTWDFLGLFFLLVVVVGSVFATPFLLFELLHRHFDFLRSREFKVGGLCVLFLLGTLLYFTMSKEFDWHHLCLVLEAPNKALSAFFRSQGGLNEISSGTGAGCVATLTSVCYYLFQFFIVLYLAGLTFSFIGLELFNAICLFRCDPCRTLGHSHKSELLVRSLREKNGIDDVVFVLSQSDEFDDDRKRRLIHEISRLRSDDGHVQCHWRFVDYGKPKIEDVSADRNFFISESGRSNIALAQKAIDAYQGDRNRNPQHDGKNRDKVFYVRVETSSDEKYFSEWIDPLCKGNVEKGIAPVDVRILKESDMIAESLVTHCPVVMRMPTDVTPGVKSDKPFNVLIVGFGKNGRSVLNKTIENSQCSWRDFRATVVDKDLKSWQAFERKCGEAVREYHISFRQREFGTCAFSEFLEYALNSCAYDRIIVCLGDDKQALSFCSEAERIQREKFPRVRETPIYVQMDEPYAAFEKGENGESGDNRECVVGANLRCLAMASNITIFGTLNHIYNMYCIDDEAVLRTAKWLQYWYNGGDDGCGHKKKLKMAKDCGQFTKMRTQIMDEEWKSTRYFDKCSTRSAAFGQRNLLRMLGFEIRQLDVKKSEDWIVSREEFETCISGGVLDLLAECEHLRWNAFHFVRGIRKWDMQSPSIDEVYGSLLAEAGLERSCQQEVLEGRAYLEVLKEIKHNQIKRMNAHAALVPFRDLPRTDADFDNFLCGIMHQGLSNAVPADFQGEKRRRHCAVVDEVAYGFGLNCDAMQENDFKFSRTLYDNVMNSGCVLVWQKQKKEGEK